MKLLLGFLTLLFCGCAPALFHADYPAEALDSAEKVSLSATENGDTVPVPENLKAAYTKRLKSSVPENCRLKIFFDGKVKERYMSPWYLGIFLLAPFWPAMPREDDIQMTAEARLFCGDIEVKKIWLLEEEHPRLFWYGPYRNGYVQERADLIHQKLMERMEQSLEQNVPADETIRSDFY